jgi:ADP-ribosylglycohydrolase
MVGIMAMKLTEAQRDRTAGVLVGAACGDALGVPYEFAAVLPDTETPRMIGGGLGPYRPGEYSDDTQMAVCIAQVTAAGIDPRSAEGLDGIARWFLRWYREGASDIGAQTRQVLAATDEACEDGAPGVAATMRRISADLHNRTGRSAGNGSLMRTGPIGIAFLDDPHATAEAARAVSELTHHDPLAGDACVIWCEAIRHAVTHGTLDGVRAGVGLLPETHRDRWTAWLDEAEHHPPRHFNPNGFVVPALQAAWSAITHTGTLEQGLVAAVRAGDDTDTVAAIAGALLGARHGLAVIPAEWRTAVNGWPGMAADDLAALALGTVRT